MIEKFTLDIEKWDSANDEDLGLVLPEGRQPVIHRYKSDNGQEFNVLVADGRKPGTSGSVELSSTSHDYRIDELMIARKTIDAVRGNTLVIASEIPGETKDPDGTLKTTGAWQTPKQTLAAMNGNYDLLALEQLKAMYSTGAIEDGSEVQISGQSMGAHMAASMLRNIANGRFEHGLDVSRLYLFDPVNASGDHSILHQFSTLGALMAEEKIRNTYYIQENKDIGHTELVPFEQQSDETMKIDKYVKLRQAPAIYLTGAGLRKGFDSTLTDALDARTELRNTEIIYARAVDSTISHAQDMLLAIEAIQKHGGRARFVSVEGPDNDDTPVAHHVRDSIRRSASHADELRRFQ